MTVYIKKIQIIFYTRFLLHFNSYEINVQTFQWDSLITYDTRIPDIYKSIQNYYLSIPLSYD